MRIGFDASPLARPHPRGIVRIVSGLLSALEARHEIEVVRLAPTPDRSLTRWRHIDLPKIAAELELAGMHSCLSAFPLRARVPRIQTIHELPWKHGVAENADLGHRAWAAFGPIFAERVVCATEFVARDLRRRILPGASKIVVCPWGIGAPFAEEPPAGTIDEVILGRYRLPQSPLALCLGAVRPKKNLAAVIAGLAQLRRRGGPPVQLVVTGGDTPQLRKDLGLVARLGLSRFVSTLDEVAEEDLPSLLRLASVVPVLSRSEGFGMPVLEALACATPVLVPRASAQAEVAGRFGIEVDPDDPASVAAGLERAIAERESLRSELPARARELSWDRCAAQVESIWREIA